jgi:hypothetical protein
MILIKVTEGGKQNVLVVLWHLNVSHFEVTQVAKLRFSAQSFDTVHLLNLLHQHGAELSKVNIGVMIRLGVTQ